MKQVTWNDIYNLLMQEVDELKKKLGDQSVSSDDKIASANQALGMLKAINFIQNNFDIHRIRTVTK